MGDELKTQFQIEGRQTRQIVIECLSSLILSGQDWKGETPISISHCSVPGQSTDCRVLIAVTEIRTKEREVSGICRGCSTEFVFNLYGSGK